MNQPEISERRDKRRGSKVKVEVEKGAQRRKNITRGWNEVKFKIAMIKFLKY